MGAQELGFDSMDPAFELERRHHLRHHRLVAVAADADLDLVIEVDALDLLQKAMDEVLARLFTISNHVQPRLLLRLDPQQRGVELGLGQRWPFRQPTRPELAGLGQPGGFGKAAGDGRVEHGRGVLWRVWRVGRYGSTAAVVLGNSALDI